MFKKVIVLLITVALFFTTIGLTKTFSAETETVDVSISANFDGEEIGFFLDDIKKDSSFVFDVALVDQSLYEFSYWIIDGYLVENLELLSEFSLNVDISLSAVFHKVGNVSVIFVDPYGEVIDVQSVPSGMDADDTVFDNPSKAGYRVSDDPWGMPITGITENTIFTLHYTALEAVVTEFYRSSFEDASKGSYSIGVISSNSKNWSLNEALIGTLANDQKDLLKSIRLKPGDVTSEFGVENIKEISFLKGKYLSDGDSVVGLEISTDKTNWIVLDNAIPAGGVFDRYTYTFTEELRTSLGVVQDTEYYIRIVNSGTQRVNIDDIQIMHEVIVDDGIVDESSDTLTITIPVETDYILSLNDTFVNPVCTAVDSIIGVVDCNVTGTVDTSNIGAYDVSFSAVDGEGKTLKVIKEFIVFRDESLLDIDYEGYYDGIEGLYGEALIIALRNILNEDLNRISYGDSRYLLDDIDEDPNNPEKILTIYTRELVDEEWDAGVTWSREHVWPNSRLGVPRVDNSDLSIASDLHNLRACVSSINSSRSNKVYALTTTSSTYYPGDFDKGDVARILFYMLVMYDELELVEEILPNDPSTNYTLEGADMSILQYLIMWHYEDDVDAFEQARNDAIFTFQNNRNPFIDYEYLVELVWYEHVSIPEVE